MKIDLSFLTRLKPDLTRITDFFRYGAGSRVGDLADAVKKRIPEDWRERMPERRSLLMIAGGVAALIAVGGVLIFLMRGGKDEEKQAAAPAPAPTAAASGGSGANKLPVVAVEGEGERKGIPVFGMPMPPRLTGSAALLNPTPPPGGSPPPGEPAKPQMEQKAASPAAASQAGEAAKPGEKPLAAIPPLRPDEMEQAPQGKAEASAPAPVQPLASRPAVKPERTNALARAPGEPANPKPEGDAAIVPSFSNLKPPAAPPVALTDPPKLDKISRRVGNALLPMTASDGTTVAQVFARPFPKEDARPKVAIVVTDLGLSKEATEAAIAKLPPEVTLAFSPYADRLGDWIKKARAAGHEVLIGLPLEPENFPSRDPGPFGLLSFLSADENAKRLDTVLGRGFGYVGLIASMGGKFLGDPEALKPLFKALKDRGVLFVDNGLAAKSATEAIGKETGLSFAVADVWLDDRAFRSAIDARLFKAEELAKANGRSLAVLSAKPVSLERITAWHAALEGKGVAIAPVSAVVRQGGT